MFPGNIYRLKPVSLTNSIAVDILAAFSSKSPPPQPCLLFWGGGACGPHCFFYAAGWRQRKGRPWTWHHREDSRLVPLCVQFEKISKQIAHDTKSIRGNPKFLAPPLSIIRFLRSFKASMGMGWFCRPSLPSHSWPCSLWDFAPFPMENGEKMKPLFDLPKRRQGYEVAPWHGVNTHTTYTPRLTPPDSDLDHHLSQAKDLPGSPDWCSRRGHASHRTVRDGAGGTCCHAKDWGLLATYPHPSCLLLLARVFMLS